jgi:putative cardiolipin synthase
MIRNTVLCALGLGLVLVAGCALPLKPLGPQSTALPDASTTSLYQMAQKRLGDDGRSGFRALPVASFAFATRTTLARRAERTLDVQYYEFHDDDTGRAMMRALADAGARGVRVRILIDDLHSTGEDRILGDLDRLPNVEVRLFNPFAGARGNTALRLLGAAFDLERINRRMHNKLFIADNSMALAGGRNLANEYFMQDKSNNFVDLDMFVAGPAVRLLSQAFDRYWNSDRSYPIGSVADLPKSAALAQADFDALTANAKGPALQDLPAEFAEYGTLPGELQRGELGPLELAPVEVVADDPDKPLHIDDARMQTVTRTVLGYLSRANKEVDIVSPYFVPGENGVAMMTDAMAHNGTIRVFTNSLASTDAPVAEYGYMRYRKQMLEAHVELYEMSPALTRDRERLGPFARSFGSLHAKAVSIDRRYLFIGSMNLDARSSLENTEVGLIIDSPALTEKVVGLLDLGSFYRLELTANGDIQWIASDAQGEHVYDTDPETTWWQRVNPIFTGLLVPEDQL